MFTLLIRDLSIDSESGENAVAHVGDVERVDVAIVVDVPRVVIDAGIQARERLVGQIGSTVKPTVYLTMGISGAIQHISGMDKSEMIIAVNTDPEGLIFNIADV